MSTVPSLAHSPLPAAMAPVVRPPQLRAYQAVVVRALAHTLSDDAQRLVRLAYETRGRQLVAGGQR